MSGTQPGLDYLDVGGARLAYRLRAGSSPTLLFLPGYASDMDGSKALALDAFAASRGAAMARFDYSGTGSSQGRFAEGTLDRWIDEALAMAERLSEGPLILVGSSMGAWIALHVALRLPERVQSLVGIAAAPDFTDWGFTAQQKKQLLDHGSIERSSPHGGEAQLTTRAFWESGESLRLLGGPIAVDCPVRLVHGEADADVPPAIALKLMRQLRSADVQLNILKGGGHRLSEPLEIDAIVRTVAALLEPEP
ncbi:alpha/beta hydrolase [Sphingomonas sp.]|uniref:alpha/beta fold hydrolase n=1 Tax=Sphingomonas sp. TaxID=28214 RepID=UPI001798E64F|nr:alpha/beta hydrolase [Sphingomonas sp.]MBA3511741.1 alpha/beta hydrolase [Sphingomonas sp.]